jgi:cellulose synthase (UDP-forming)
VKVAIRLPDGSSVDGVTSTLSQSGGQVDLAALDRPIDPASIEGADVEASFAVGANWLTVPVRIVRWGDSSLQLRFRVASVTEEAKVVRIVFGRADAWIDWAAYPEDHPLASLWRVLVSIGGLFRAPDAAPPAASPPTPLVPPRRIARVGRLAAIMLLCMLPPATAQVPGSLTIRPIAQPVAPLPPVEMPAPTAGVRVIRRTLHELGVPGPLTLRGTSPLQGVQFGVRADEVVTEATLDVVGAMSPALIPAFSNDTVTLNEQYVGTIPVVPSAPTFNLRIPLSPVFFQDINRLNFNFSGRYTNDCMDPLSTLLWSTVYDSSTLTLTLQRLPPQRELQRLPLPFFDPREQTQLTLPFLLPANPSNPALTAAGIVASWFGQLSAFRGAVFPVLATPPTEGNAVLVVVGDTAPAGMALPPITGPTVGVIANPADKLSSLLLIAGRTGEEAVVAAQALVLGSRALAGSVTGVSAPEIAVRKPYDAPAWIPTDRPVRFGELAPPEDLQVHGYTGLVHVPFRTAPDLVTWRNHGFAERLRWRAPDAPVVDVAPSRFDAGINGVYLDSFSLAASPHAPSWLAWLTSPGGAPREVRMDVPPYALASSNDLQFFFDARPLNRGKCVATPQDIRMALDPESSIDLSRAYRFTSMPNLGFFAGSGFPFTRMADLSSTAVVLPERPTPVEIGAFLTMMGRFGSLTGIPSVRVAVVRPNQVATLADRDLLLMSTLPHLGSAASLLSDTRLRVEGERVTMVLPTPFDRVRAWFGESGARDRAEAATRFTAAFGESGMAMVSGESPLAAGKSLVALLAGEPQGLDAIVASLRDPDRARQIQGDLALLSADRVTSYRVGPRYYVGWLPPWMWPDLLLRDQPFGLFGLVAGGSLLLGLAMFWAMRRRAAWRVRQLAERLQ